MTQTELAKELNVSKAYISMVLSGKKKPSKRITERLTNLVNSEAKNPILSHARLPVPTLPHVQSQRILYHFA
jgi:transcriptional regulator with XRE-family HTH domain